MKSPQKIRRVGLPIAVASTLALVACAGGSPPAAEMRGARDSIARAQYDGAAHFAPQPFQGSQDKLNRAQGSVQNNDMRQARDLAEEAQADADYADAVSNAQKAANGASQLQDLQQQLQQ